MSGASTVHVSGISHTTSEKEVRDFFSFWYVAASLPRKSSELESKKPIENSFSLTSRLQWKDHQLVHHSRLI